MKTRRTYTLASRAEAAAATRERVARAAVELFSKTWFEDVTLAAIAAAAGVSHQTVLNHFESKEGVARAAWELVGSETTARRGAARSGDTRSCVHVLVGEYEQFGDSNALWAASAARLGSLASLLDDARASHQRWLEEKFTSWLPRSAAARRRRINALHAATDVYTWKLLRRDLRLSRAETERIMIELVEGALSSSEEASP